MGLKKKPQKELISRNARLSFRRHVWGYVRKYLRVNPLKDYSDNGLYLFNYTTK